MVKQMGIVTTPSAEFNSATNNTQSSTNSKNEDQNNNKPPENTSFNSVPNEGVAVRVPTIEGKNLTDYHYGTADVHSQGVIVNDNGQTKIKLTSVSESAKQAGYKVGDVVSGGYDIIGSVTTTPVSNNQLKVGDYYNVDTGKGYTQQYQYKGGTEVQPSNTTTPSIVNVNSSSSTNNVYDYGDYTATVNSNNIVFVPKNRPDLSYTMDITPFSSEVSTISSSSYDEYLKNFKTSEPDLISKAIERDYSTHIQTYGANSLSYQEFVSRATPVYRQQLESQKMTKEQFISSQTPYWQSQYNQNIQDFLNKPETIATIPFILSTTIERNNYLSSDQGKIEALKKDYIKSGEAEKVYSNSPIEAKIASNVIYSDTLSGNVARPAVNVMETLGILNKEQSGAFYTYQHNVVVENVAGTLANQDVNPEKGYADIVWQANRGTLAGVANTPYNLVSMIPFVGKEASSVVPHDTYKVTSYSAQVAMESPVTQFTVAYGTGKIAGLAVSSLPFYIEGGTRTIGYGTDFVTSQKASRLAKVGMVGVGVTGVGLSAYETETTANQLATSGVSPLVVSSYRTQSYGNLVFGAVGFGEGISKGNAYYNTKVETDTNIVKGNIDINTETLRLDTNIKTGQNVLYKYYQEGRTRGDLIAKRSPYIREVEVQLSGKVVLQDKGTIEAIDNSRKTESARVVEIKRNENGNLYTEENGKISVRTDIEKTVKVPYERTGIKYDYKTFEAIQNKNGKLDYNFNKVTGKYSEGIDFVKISDESNQVVKTEGIVGSHVNGETTTGVGKAIQYEVFKNAQKGNNKVDMYQVRYTKSESDNTLTAGKIDLTLTTKPESIKVSNIYNKEGFEFLFDKGKPVETSGKKIELVEKPKPETTIEENSAKVANENTDSNNQVSEQIKKVESPKLQNSQLSSVTQEITNNIEVTKSTEPIVDKTTYDKVYDTTGEFSTSGTSNTLQSNQKHIITLPDGTKLLEDPPINIANKVETTYYEPLKPPVIETRPIMNTIQSNELLIDNKADLIQTQDIGTTQLQSQNFSVGLLSYETTVRSINLDNPRLGLPMNFNFGGFGGWGGRKIDMQNYPMRIEPIALRKHGILKLGKTKSYVNQRADIISEESSFILYGKATSKRASIKEIRNENPFGRVLTVEESKNKKPTGLLLGENTMRVINRTNSGVKNAFDSIRNINIDLNKRFKI